MHYTRDMTNTSPARQPIAIFELRESSAGSYLAATGTTVYRWTTARELIAKAAAQGRTLEAYYAR